MPKTRVLVVDDAVVVRRLVTLALQGDPDIEVVGVAAHGRIALARIPQLNPDIITLDIEMPELDGLQTLAELRKLWPRLPVIMFSTLTERGAVATLDALSLGASDYVTKPSGMGNTEEALARVRAELVPRIKTLCPRPSTVDASTGPPGIPSAGGPAVPRPSTPAEIVAVGVSTGGPNALSDILPALPGSFPAPLVIVQHMPPLFTRFLAERLDARCAISVKEAEPGDRLRAGWAYIAPGGQHLVVERRGVECILVTNDDPPENSCRPAVDVLFRSVAACYGPDALAVVLTGMGQDGLRGAELIHEAGGRILVQDEATSVVWGMPGFVARSGLADAVLPLDALPAEIECRVSRRIEMIRR